MRSYAKYLGLACLLLVASCRPNGSPVARNLVQPRPTEFFVHEPSDFRFPAILGDFAREAVKRYDRDGQNVSVGYNLGQSVAMTVFVYPVSLAAPDKTLGDHFEACKRDVVSRHKGAAVVSEGPTMVAPGGQQRLGQHAAFTYTALFARRQQDVRSELYLFMDGKWFIKYRVTYPVGDQQTAEPAVKAFIEDLSWPARDFG